MTENPDERNADDLRVTDVYTTYRVLETLRQNAVDDGDTDAATTLNEAHCLIQDYEQGSMWNSPLLDAASVTLTFDDICRATLAEVYTRNGYGVTDLYFRHDEGESQLRVDFEMEGDTP